jgi:hypothetical protein
MKIEEIRDIVRLLNDYYDHCYQPFDTRNESLKDNKPAEFLKILSGSATNSDEEAAKKLYKADSRDKRYRFFKSYFTARVMDSLHHLQLQKENISDSTRAAYKLYKGLFNVSILLRLGRRKAGLSLAKKLLLLSEKFEMHYISANLLEHLRTDAMILGNKRKYELYAEQHERTLILLSSETKLRILEQRLRINSALSSYIDENLVTDSLESLKTARYELENCDTFLNRLSYYRLAYMHYQYSGNPLESFRSCNEALIFLKRRQYLTPRIRFGEFELYKLENSLLMRDYLRGFEMVSECAKYYKKGTNGWFNYKQYHFLLLLQSSEIKGANEIFLEVTSHPRFHSEPEHIQERWKIFELYLNYLNDQEEKIKGLISNKRSYPLRQKKYRKAIIQFPSYSKDKRGFNVALLTMNILLLLENDKKDSLIQQFEALSTYRFTHLHGKNSQESSLLFKLIRLMVRNDFDTDRIFKKAKPIEIQLSKSKPSRGEILECVQIMPPVWVWARMKEALIKLKERRN